MEEWPDHGTLHASVLASLSRVSIVHIGGTIDARAYSDELIGFLELPQASNSFQSVAAGPCAHEGLI